ncbi:MAG: methyltransferase domain-containing protein [Endomicrobiales bacterium]|nr:methyltransferase domain-containing protein [Endomicrobiales bacterium]
MLSKRERRDLIDVVYKAAMEEKIRGNEHVDNLTSRFSVQSYLDMAEEIKKYLPKGRILDWGCGYGHMSFFLRKLGFEVVSYDVFQDNSQKLIMKSLEVKPVVKDDGTLLPFEDSSFDAVLSCGVLEHVGNEQGSLKEVRRVLKKNGYFFIYRFPNILSYTELIATIRNKSCHPVKYTISVLKKRLGSNGFNVIKTGRENIIPKNLSFIPVKVKNIFNYNYELWGLLEKALLHIPVVSLFCGALNAVCIKQD